MATNRIKDGLWLAQSRVRAGVRQPSSEEPGLPIAVTAWIEKAEKLIASNPGLSLVAAAGAGILVGWLVKRT